VDAAGSRIPSYDRSLPSSSSAALFQADIRVEAENPVSASLLILILKIDIRAETDILQTGIRAEADILMIAIRQSGALMTAIPTRVILRAAAITTASA
jgi:hypothetical protein